MLMLKESSEEEFDRFILRDEQKKMVSGFPTPLYIRLGIPTGPVT